MKQVRIMVAGRVQGVLYRRSAQAQAKKLGIAGWARNLIDGRVEMLCQGDDQAIEKFLEWARRGPFFAAVKTMEAQEEPVEENLVSFEVREFGF